MNSTSSPDPTRQPDPDPATPWTPTASPDLMQSRSIVVSSDAERDELVDQTEGICWLWAEHQPWITWCSEDGDWYALRPLTEDDLPTDQRAFGPVRLDSVAYPWALAPVRPFAGPVQERAVRSCTGCGCTDDNACMPPCSWISAARCSACGPADHQVGR